MRLSGHIMIALTLTSALLAGCGRAGGGVPMLAKSKKRVSATIFLIGPDVDHCKAKVSPFRIQPKNNEAADWTVIDLCADVTKGYTEKVTLTFTPGDAGNCGSGPIFGSTNVAEGTMNFQGDIDVKCKTDEIFKYTVAVGSHGVLADPELEIGQ